MEFREEGKVVRLGGGRGFGWVRFERMGRYWVVFSKGELVGFC